MPPGCQEPLPVGIDDRGGKPISDETSCSTNFQIPVRKTTDLRNRMCWPTIATNYPQAGSRKWGANGLPG